MDFAVPKAKTRHARKLLHVLTDYFEVEKRTVHTYYESAPKVEVDVLSPPAIFRGDFKIYLGY
jgi:hypothetical protein